MVLIIPGDIFHPARPDHLALAHISNLVKKSLVLGHNLFGVVIQYSFIILDQLSSSMWLPRLTIAAMKMVFKVILNSLNLCHFPNVGHPLDAVADNKHCKGVKLKKKKNG